MLTRINSVPEALRAGPDRTIRLHRSRGGTPAAWGQVSGRLARLKGLWSRPLPTRPGWRVPPRLERLPEILLKVGHFHHARTAPGGEKIEDHNLVVEIHGLIVNRSDRKNRGNITDPGQSALLSGWKALRAHGGQDKNCENGPCCT